MVVGREVALVLRARGGANFLLQRSGDNAPGFALGEMLVDGGRYRVVYRMVNMVYVMAVAAAATNVFYIMQLVEGALRVLVAAARGVEITPDKVTRRYPEVYLALGAVLDSGGAADATAALSEADSTVVAALPEAVKASTKSLSAKLRLGRPSKGSGPATPDASVTARAGVSNRRLEDAAEPLARVHFKLPADALTPLPSGSKPSQSRTLHSRQVSFGADPFAGAFGVPPVAQAGAAPQGTDDPFFDAFGPSAQQPQPSRQATASDPFGGAFDAFAGLGREPGAPAGLADLLTGPAPVAQQQAAGADPFALPGQAGAMPAAGTPTAGLVTQGTGSWAAFGGTQRGGFGATAGRDQMMPSQQAAASTPAVSAPVPAARPASKEDAAAVAEGRALQLAESWRGEFRGSKLTRAGVTGEVTGSGAVRGAACKASFGLHPPKAGGKILSAGLRCALLDSRGASREQARRDRFTADLGSVAAAAVERHAFLRYRLPAVACAPPVLLRVTPVTPREAGPQAPILLIVQVAVSPRLAAPLRSGTLSLNLPRPVGNPSKVSPQAAWSPNQRILRWEIPDLEPGVHGAYRAAFIPVFANAALAAAGVYGGAGPAAALDVVATLQFQGSSSSTLSGTALESGAAVNECQPGSASWSGTAVAHPERV